MIIRLGSMAVVSLSFVLSTGTALASGPDAWEEFRQDVQEKCLLATLPHAQTMEPVGQLVDPFGSESYGFSIIQMRNKETHKMSLIACAYDKPNMTVEISGLLGE